jgi:recombination protein RecA
MSCLRVFPAYVPQGRPPEVEGVVPASRLGVRPLPATLPTGIAQVDEIIGGGLPRGGLTEIVGQASSGRTTLLLAALAAATAREEVCTLIDASEAFDPHSAAAAGVDLKRVLWTRCGGNQPQRHRGTEKSRRNQSPQDFASSVSLCLRGGVSRARAANVEQALRALDLLLQAGGFGLVALDLGDVPAAIARRIPLTSWFRYRRAVENTSTVLLVLETEASARSCASLVLGMQQSAISIQQSEKSVAPTHARLLRGLEVNIEVLNSRFLQRKPVGSARSKFVAQAAWVG